jgi:hypothetical protein
MNILEGNGTEQQNSVVLANASVALYHTHKFELMMIASVGQGKFGKWKSIKKL